MCGLAAEEDRQVLGSVGVNRRLSPAEVAELEHSGLGVQQQVLGLDVPVADPKRVDVGQAPEQLVHVQLQPNTHTHKHRLVTTQDKYAYGRLGNRSE